MNGKLTSYTDILNPENFVKFPNADKSTGLDKETRDFLKNIGVYGHKEKFPYLTPSKTLQKRSSSFIQFGQNHIDEPYCIDTTNGSVVGIDDSTPYVINTSIKAYMDCSYLLEKFMKEIRRPQALGDYGGNLEKYSDKLTEMLEEVEPTVKDLHVWGSLLEESRAGFM